MASPDDFTQIGQATFNKSDVISSTQFTENGQNMNRVQLKNGLVFEFSDNDSGFVKMSQVEGLQKVSVFMSNAKIYGDYSSFETKDYSFKPFVLDVKGDNNNIDTSKDSGGYNPACGCKNGIDDMVYVEGYGNNVTIGKNDVLVNKNTGEFNTKPKTYKI